LTKVIAKGYSFKKRNIKHAARVRACFVGCGKFLENQKGEVIVRLKKIIRLFSAACVLGLLTMAVVATPISAAPEVTINPEVALPGSTVSITGRGFATSGDVTINPSWGSGAKTVALVDGTFSTTIEAPATPGDWTISFVSGGFTAVPDASLKVAVVTLNPNVKSGCVGDVVTLSGGGYTANQQIAVLWDGSALRTLTASSTGTVSGTFNVPASFGGNHTITVSGIPGISHTFTVNPKITLETPTGGVGDTIIVNGTGFSATASPITITLNSMAQTARNYPDNTIPTSTGNRGSFSVSFTMPTLTSGNYTVRADDGHGLYATDTLTATPKITLGSTKGIIGETVSISGNGFSSSQNITFTMDGSPLTVSPSPVKTFSTGYFSPVNFVVPSVVGGSHVIVATDEDGHDATIAFTVAPSLTDISTSYGVVGGTVIVRGNGFIPSSSVTVTWDGALPTAVNSTSAGIVNATLTIPTIAGGVPHIITMTDNSGNSVDVAFEIIPSITVDKAGASGGYGDVIPITFKGFTVGKGISSVQIILNSVAYEVGLYQTVSVGAEGTVSAVFRVPAICGGTGIIQTTDGDFTTEGASFTVTPKLTLQDRNGNTINSGSAGDIVVIVATGFGVYRGLSFTCNGVSVATNPSNLETNENGGAQFYFALPEMEAGLIKLVVRDGSAVGYGVNIAEADFIVEARIVPEFNTSQSNPGYVGLSMKVDGTGFKGNDAVAIFFSGKQIGSAPTSSSGSFTVTIKIPAAAAGGHIISVSDGLITQEVNFFMESAAPGVATLKSPEANARPGQPVVFSWNGVSDPSGVTYVLQISQDPNFATLIFQKTGISTNSFKMGDMDILAKSGADEPYYWRVMAIDLADNQGDWSAASTFTIGSSGWPVWATIVLICFGSIIAIALLLFLGLWLGHRLAYRSY